MNYPYQGFHTLILGSTELAMLSSRSNLGEIDKKLYFKALKARYNKNIDRLV